MDWPVIKIMAPDKTFLGEIDLYTSLRFKRSWQGIGDFEIHIAAQEYNPSLFTADNLIMLDGDIHRAGIIRKMDTAVSSAGLEIVIQGQHLDGLLSQRIVIPYEGEANGGYFCVPKKASVSSVVKPVPAETILKTFVREQIPYATSGSSINPRGMYLDMESDMGRGMKTVWMSRYDPLDEVLQSVCEYTDMGYGIAMCFEEYGSAYYVFDVIEGVDRTEGQNENSRVIMSLEFESIADIQYTMDTTSYRNVAYAGGAGEDYNRTVLAVTNEKAMPSGYQRKETFVDCGSLDITETDTALSLTEEGKHMLEEYKRAESMTASISSASPFKYREHYDLGDLVTIYVPELGIAQDMRVTEAEECFEPNGISLNITFGTAQPHIGRAIRALQPKIR